MQHHKYSLTELENMVPWEREIYVDLLVNHIKEEKEKAREAEMMGAKEADASAATKAATMPMSMGGETSKRRPIDGAAIRGLTKGRIS